ncbi:MAG: uncharacterized protein JWQ71_4694, partial [Pedosphaera sp.]|nr:uncharacterized protein [Pedosphaera sp.]
MAAFSLSTWLYPGKILSIKSPLFASANPIIGMIHVGALPGTPGNTLSLDKIVATAVREAKIYRDAGLDGIAI